MQAEENKAIAVVFDVPGMTAEEYDQIAKALEDADAENPQGRLYHLAAPKEGGWFVVDVWESIELRDQFIQTIIPIFKAAGVAPPEPQILSVHNIIEG